MDIKLWDEAAQCLKILAHPQRLQMIELMLNGNYSVGQLAQACGILQNVASEHLKLMKLKGFIIAEKQGRLTFYKVQEPALFAIMRCIKSRFSEDKESK